MSSSSMIHELFRTLETTLHERLTLIEQVVQTIEKPKVPLYDNEFVRRIDRLEALIENGAFQGNVTTQNPVDSLLEERLNTLEEQLANLMEELDSLKKDREVLSLDLERLQQQKAEEAMKAEEEEEVVEEEVVEEEEATEGEVVEEEEEEEEAVEEELVLEDFEYKGRTYYKDTDNNVYATDDEGDVITEPIGRWNGKKIVAL